MVPRRYTAFSNNKKMVTILHRELESKVEKVRERVQISVGNPIMGNGPD